MKKGLILIIAIHLQLIAFSQTTYRFTGNGNWSLVSNWLGNLRPPTLLPGGDTIYIQNIPGGNCTLDIADTISQGAQLIVTAGSNFIVPANLLINNWANLPGVNICGQTWSLKNLDVDHYQNGDSIPQVTDASTWANLTTGAWCYYNNAPTNNPTYGKLYNWYAVNDPRGLAPAGWHIPNENEWNLLIKCIDNNSDTSCSSCMALSLAGGRMKTYGTSLWLSPNTGGINSSGFTAVPAGYRTGIGGFESQRELTGWWSINEYTSYYSYWHAVFYNSADALKNNQVKSCGYSVRVVRD